ncbi:MAG: zinc ribbon domain-containing protein [Nitrospirae bacterium]|nr:zinc ribbon domain-containing protein [Nitrospirota bacterium]
MICFKCSTDNSDIRKFCRRCGSLIANICRKCGFSNSLDDQYCGGCGSILASASSPPSSQPEKELIPQAGIRPAGGYTDQDIKELMESSSEKKDKKPKKKEKTDSDQLSQDALDELFNSEDKN